MTRRGIVLLVAGGLVVAVLPLVLLASAVLSVLPNSDQARESAQAAADRAAPGQVLVTEARWRGEAGGYSVSAQLVADPSRRFGWDGERRCDPGTPCEQRIRAMVANARDGAAEHDALERAFRSCGMPATRIVDVQHDALAVTREPQTLEATLTVTAPADDPATGPRLDGCVLAWTAQRGGLLPVERHTATIWLADPAGHVHSTAQVVVDDGRVTTSSGATLAPVR